MVEFYRMNHRVAIRIQKSILHKAEKKLLVRIAERLPERIKSDHLTAIGLAGAIISATGYVLANRDIAFLWVSSFGLLINWFGDSLDGTLARVRNTQRPIYGFFVDHCIDGITITVMCIAAGLSPLISLYAALLVLAGYLLLSIFTYINTYLRGEFKLTFGMFGPTEFRIIVILINTLFIYFPVKNQAFDLLGRTFKTFDIIGIVIALILFIIYLAGFFSDRKKYNRMDPLPSFRGSNSKKQGQ